MTSAHSTPSAATCNPRPVPPPHFPPLLGFEGLAPRDFQVAAALEEVARGDPGCWPAVASLAARVAACRRTVQYSLRRLVRAGALAIAPAANPTGRVLFLGWRRGGVQPAAPPPGPGCTPPHDGTGVLATGCTLPGEPRGGATGCARLKSSENAT